MTWDGIVTNFYKQYVKDIGLTDMIRVYIQLIVSAFGSVTFENCRGLSSEQVSEGISINISHNKTDSKNTT